jgi:NTE family protein
MLEVNIVQQQARELLHSVLSEYFATADAVVLDRIQAQSEHIDLPSGGVLFHQGECSDDVYFVLSGRLRAIATDAKGATRTLGEIARGETIGELALFTGEPRMASIVALRDSLVVKISRSDIETALAGSPKLAMAMTRIVIDRFRRGERKRKAPNVPVNICLLPITAGVDAVEFASRLSAARAAYGTPAAVITPRDIAGRFGRNPDDGAWRTGGAIARFIDEIEACSSAVLLVADREATDWTRFCIQCADQILLLADAEQAPAVSAAEAEFLEGETSAPIAFQTLVLLHRAERRSPRGTGLWRSRRAVDRHLHIRPKLERDMRRLARILCGRAVGLVLSGGGARGFAHIGIVNALAESGIEPDFIGGTSIGAVMGSWVAMEVGGDALVDAGHKAFRRRNVTGDYNWLPFVSLIKGERTRDVTAQAILDAAGGDIDIEDTWKTCFTVASDFSTSREAILTGGNFVRNILASLAIPGALPPIFIDGHLMCDGGSFNNFPVDVMEGLGVGQIIGVDLSPDDDRLYDIDRVPTTWRLLVDRLRPRAQRRYCLPGLPETLLTASFVSSMAKQKAMRERTDLLFRPDIRGVGMLDWKKYEEVVAAGHRHAKGVLAGLSPAALARVC